MQAPTELFIDTPLGFRVPAPAICVLDITLSLGAHTLPSWMDAIQRADI